MGYGNRACNDAWTIWRDSRSAFIDPAHQCWSTLIPAEARRSMLIMDDGILSQVGRNCASTILY
jgi:hypothetical protein